MKFNQAGPAIRLLFLNMSLILWLGIWLTGFDTVHWVLYIPTAFISFAAITGICPGLIISNMIFKKKD